MSDYFPFSEDVNYEGPLSFLPAKGTFLGNKFAVTLKGHLPQATDTRRFGGSGEIVSPLLVPGAPRSQARASKACHGPGLPRPKNSDGSGRTPN